MITKTIVTEFGSYEQKYNHGYEVHTDYFCIDAYETPENIDDWMNCPCCGLKPKTWVFDNGRSTACGCWENRYDIFSVRVESIMSVHIRCNGNLQEYSSDQLRLNWNEYCTTMINPCNHADLRFEGKW